MLAGETDIETGILVMSLLHDMLIVLFTFG